MRTKQKMNIVWKRLN